MLITVMSILCLDKSFSPHVSLSPSFHRPFVLSPLSSTVCWWMLDDINSDGIYLQLSNFKGYKAFNLVIQTWAAESTFSNEILVFFPHKSQMSCFKSSNILQIYKKYCVRKLKLFSTLQYFAKQFIIYTYEVINANKKYFNFSYHKIIGKLQLFILSL